MTFLDYNAKLTKSSAWDLSQGVGTYYTPDAYDLGKNAVSLHDIGAGEDIYVIIQMTEALTSTGSATIQFQVGTSTNGAGADWRLLTTTRAFNYDEFVVASSGTGLLYTDDKAAGLTLKIQPLDLKLTEDPLGTPDYDGTFLTVRAVIGGATTDTGTAQV